MLAIFLFILYIAGFSALLHYLSITKRIEIDSRSAIIGYMIKTSLGCIYGYLFARLYGGDDTWNYHQQSLVEAISLHRDPWLYVKHLFSVQHYVEQYKMNQIWESVQYGLFIKLLAILNIFSGGAYYVNVALFNMLSFWGGYCFYRLFCHYFSQSSPWIWWIIFGYIPVVFWTSGVRKDGLIFLSIGMFVYGLSKYILDRKMTALTWCLLGLGLLSLNRSLLILSILPAGIAWIVSSRRPSNPFLIQLLITFAFLVIYTLLPISFRNTLIQKNHEFHLLQGTRLPLPVLESSWTSILKAIPRAFVNVSLQPLPVRLNNPLLFLSGLETIFTLFIATLAFCFPHSITKHPTTKQLIAFIVSVSLLNYVFIGLIVPFPGAIIRYRCIFELMLITVSCLSIDWIKLKRYILNKF